MDRSYQIAKNFAKRRKEHKITQKQLSLSSGIPLASIKKFEQKGDISLKSLIKIARALQYESELLKLFKNPYYADIEDMINK